MARTLFEILALTWEQQVDCLRGMTRLELEVLVFELGRLPGTETWKKEYDQFYLAAVSVLRDRREDEGQSKPEVRPWME